MFSLSGTREEEFRPSLLLHPCSGEVRSAEREQRVMQFLQDLTAFFFCFRSLVLEIARVLKYVYVCTCTFSLEQVNSLEQTSCLRT